MFCRNCGAQTDDAAQFCIKCGANLKEPGAAVEPPYQPAPPHPPGAVPEANSGWTPPVYGPPPPGATPAGQWTPAAPVNGTEQKSKLAAALLGIFLGVFGIHRFYLGYTAIGIVQLVLGIVTCGIVSSIWGLIEGILILVGSINKDANGVPLRD